MSLFEFIRRKDCVSRETAELQAAMQRLTRTLDEARRVSAHVRAQREKWYA